MSKLGVGVLVVTAALWVPAYCVAADAEGAVSLQGQYVAPDQPSTQTSAEAKDVPLELRAGRPLDLAALLVLEDRLAERVAQIDPAERIRVIIYLDYQPQDVLASGVKARYGPQMQQLREQIKALTAAYAAQRDVKAPTDAENYVAAAQAMSAADVAALRGLNEQHEALSLAIKNELTAALAAEIHGYQQSVWDAVEALGGTVEFGTLAGNALVASVPAGALAQLATVPKVARVVDDQPHEAYLNIADDATLVSAANGLWQNGYDGGAYDPAVLDSGTDLAHPALQNNAGRTNFYSWYLVAAAAAANWSDVISEDDRNGHGTHVIGIVGSYGSTGWTDYLGMAHGVEKIVTLKAGYNATDGRAYMYPSDAMFLVDRALYDTNSLQPFSSFNDDVDGINLSYGGDTSSDDTDYGRFWDSVVSSYSDLLVTISAGNSGPANPVFTDPACAYNPITVANVQDQNTTSRNDDTIRSSSTRGPTAAGRRKPDLSAPGTDILAPAYDWEGGGTANDFVSKSGTSMAAPMVQGVAMDLMDAGVFDELEIKALLLNTAQKNEAGINFENDADGWSTAYGWGYMNAWAAYYHRDDVRSATVTERPTAGHYRLYSGSMRDEGAAGEGRDRATLAWNRHATYNPHDYPATYYALSDLDLHLYGESDNAYINADTTILDNVQQVRIGSGAGPTPVVVKVRAYSTDFPHGGTTEAYALATEEGFAEVPLPGTFVGFAYNNPGEMEPNEERDFAFWVQNNSQIACHNNQFDLIVPAGWTFVSGDADPFNAGSIAGGGGNSGTVTWRLRAQPTLQDGVHVSFNHTHNSYAEAWGPFNWWTAVNVRWDITPPSPNPIFATAPYALSSTLIRMVATTASDLHGPVEYYFDFFNSPTGGTGGTDSGYTGSTAYTDADLQANHRYGYRVLARDNATSRNYTAYSPVLYAYTLAAVPVAPSVSSPTPSSLDVTINDDGNPSWTEYAIWIYPTGGGVGHYLNSGGGNNGATPVWRTPAAWGTVTASGLMPDTNYSVVVRARNGDGIETSFGPAGTGRTRALCPPPAPPVAPSPRDGATNVPVSTVLSWTDGGDCAIDQYQPSGPVYMAGFSQTDLAQSFQPAAGSIGGAGILLQPGIGTWDDVTISLWDGLPNAGGVLFATGSTLGQQGNWADVTWPSVGVTPGATYYLVFTGNTTLGISGDTTNPYPYGHVYANPGFNPFPSFDFAFRTWTCGSGLLAAGESDTAASEPGQAPTPAMVAAPTTAVPEGFTIVDGVLVEGEPVERSVEAPAPPLGSMLSAAMSGPVTVIDFDDVTAPCFFVDTVRLTIEYADLNVVFAGPGGNDGGAVLNQCGGFGVAGYSSPNFLAFNRGAALSDGGVPREPETITFARPVSQVAALVGSNGNAGALLTMRAFDPGNALVDAAQVVLASTLVPISVSAPQISKLIISTPADVFVLDDLTFDCPRTYDVYLGTNPAALSLVCSDLSAPPCDPSGLLAPGVPYYWQVVAKDCCGESAGPVWSFFTTGVGPALVASEPPADGTLPKTRNNVMLLTFDGAITLPGGPALSIINLHDSTDVSASFTYTLQTTTIANDTLKAKENGAVLVNQKWYRVTRGAGFGVQPFVRDFCTLQGDADGNGTVLAQDYFPVKNHLFEVTDKRYDLDGNGQVLAQDYFVVKNHLFQTKPAKP